MATLSSADRLRAAKRVVLKIGSALLVENGSEALRQQWLDGLLADVARLSAAGKDVVIVSSGSISLGRGVLGLGAGALPLEQSQAAAAVGQIKLARAYEEGLAPHGVKTAQILLTLEDSKNRRRYINVRATLKTLLTLGVVPIVNENDTVATDEIRFGDNDRLAAQVAGMSGADVLVLLSDVDGLYTANPRQDPDAKHLALIHEITPQIEAMAGGTGSAHSKGGMKTKVLAARTALHAGCAMAIMQGDQPRPLSALEEGATCTWFVPGGDPATARKQWIDAMAPTGQLRIDAGAVMALQGGKSLLPIGVRAISGAFARGDAVEILGPDGDLVARGLVGYDADEAAQIIGRRSDEIASLLGHPGRATLVHRDDMAI